MLGIAGALVGAALAVLAAMLVGRALGWDAHVVDLTAAFSLTIALDLSGTPKAALRLFGRFDLFAIQQLITAAFKLVLVGIAFIEGAGLAAYVGIAAATVVFGNLLLIALGWVELRFHGHGDALWTGARGITREHPDLWSFVWTANASSAVEIVTKEVDVLVVGGLLGSAGAGTYRIAKQFAAFLSRPLEALYHAIYPALARLWAAGDVAAFRRLASRASLWSGGVALLVWCGLVFRGDELIGWLLGGGYSEAFPVFLWYALAMVVAVFALPLQPAGFSMGQTRLMFGTQVASALVYGLCLPVLLLSLGLPGAGIAALVFQVVWALAMLLAGLRLLRTVA